MKKYLSLFKGFIKASFMADIEYRANITIKIFGDVLWYVAQISLFEVLFSHSSQLLDWDLASMRIFMGVLFVVDGFWMFLFSENLDRLSEKIRKGDLDLLLTKPVDSLFMMSLRKLNTPYIVNIGLTTMWLAHNLMQVPHLQMINILSLLIFIPCALIMVFSMRLFFASQAIFFTNVDNLTYVWWQIYRLGTRPHNLYPSWLRLIILFFVPVGFVASVPARVVLGIQDDYFIVLSFLLAVIFFLLSRWFWRFAINHYTSASS